MCMIQSINTMEILLAVDKIESFVCNDDDGYNYNLIGRTKEISMKKLFERQTNLNALSSFVLVVPVANKSIS